MRQVSDRHEAGDARDPEGLRHLRAGAREGRPVPGRQGLHRALDYALQSIKEVAYGRWRDYDPEDAVRFYALRLHEAGIIKSSPQKIIAQGTDWRFLNELKRELKG